MIRWLEGLGERIDVVEQRIRRKFNVIPDSPENRRKARIYALYFDHELLRILWSNEYEIAPGVWRSNHPTRARFERLRDRGITRVINLRGAGESAHYMTEQETCAELGLELHSIGLNARHAPPAQALLDLVALFRQIDKPFVMHCKSGADRAGLASAIYLLAIEGRPVAEARKMFSLRFVHLKFSKTGVLDALLDAYEARQAKGAIGFEDWLRSEYDADRLQAAFNARRPYAA